MGASHAIAAENAWKHLPPLPRLILNRMALLVPDKHDDPQYWAGHDPLIEIAMGKELPADPGHKFRCGCVTCKRRKSLYEQLRRQLNVLIQAGAVEPLGRGLHGPNATYRLHLLPLSTSGALPLLTSGATPPDSRGKTPPVKRGIGISKEGDEERGRGNRSPQAGTSPAAVDNTPPKINPPPGTCPHGQPAGRLGGPGTEPTCPDCRRTTRAARS